MIKAKEAQELSKEARGRRPESSASQPRHKRGPRGCLLLPKTLTDVGLEELGEGRTNGLNRHKLASLRGWERQSNESPQAYRAFAAFRDQVPSERTAVKAAQIVGISTQLAHRWSRRHSWVNRALLFDSHIDELQLEQGIQARLEMYKRHARIACKMLEKLDRRLVGLKASSLSPDEVTKWLKLGVEVERLARGESSESAGVQIATAVQVRFGDHTPAWLQAPKS